MVNSQKFYKPLFPIFLMALTEEQIKELKKQLKEQVQNLPGSKRQEALRQIEEMSPQSIEIMLRQQQAKEKNPSEKQKNIFRLINDRDIDSYILSENKSALAVLDISPISPGHTLIIPKSPIKTTQEMPQKVLGFAKTTSKRLSSKLKAKNISLQTEEKFGETIIHLIPIYEDNLTLSSPRQKIDDKEMNKLYNLLKQKPRIKRINLSPKKKSNSNQILKVSRRIA